jgi:hypothetical protein
MTGRRFLLDDRTSRGASIAGHLFHSGCAVTSVVIQPKVGHIDSGDFTKRHEAILEGEKAAQAALPKILQLLGEHGR